MSRFDHFHENLSEYALRARQANDLDKVKQLKLDIEQLKEQVTNLINRAKTIPEAVLEGNIQYYKDLYDAQRLKAIELAEENRQLKQQLRIEKEQNSIRAKEALELQKRERERERKQRRNSQQAARQFQVWKKDKQRSNKSSQSRSSRK